MDEAQEFIDDYLAHYASQFYNPQKAHEYYLQNRELKGKRTVGQLKGKKKKEAWTYVNKQLQEKGKAEGKAVAETHKAEMKQLHEQATARRKELSDKLKILMKGISAKHKEETKRLAEERKGKSAVLTESQKREAKRISDEASAKIKALPPIPKGLDKEERAPLVAERSAEIKRIRSEATSKRKELSSSTKSERGSISDETRQEKQSVSGESKLDSKSQRDAANQERQQMATELKASVSKAQANYKALREGLKQKHEAALDKEFQAIKTGSLSS